MNYLGKSDEHAVLASRRQQQLDGDRYVRGRDDLLVRLDQHGHLNKVLMSNEGISIPAPLSSLGFSASTTLICYAAGQVGEHFKLVIQPFDIGPKWRGESRQPSFFAQFPGRV
jgi:hypothetical protein